MLSIPGENPAILGNRTLTLMFNQPLSSMGLQGRGNRAHITALPVGPVVGERRIEDHEALSHFVRHWV